MAAADCPLPTSRRGWTLTAAAVVVAWLVSLVTVVSALSTDRAECKQKIGHNAAAIEDHEQRLRTLEKDTGQMAADVRWLRENLANYLEQQRREASTP